MFSSRHNAAPSALLRASHLRPPHRSRPPRPLRTPRAAQCHPERSEGSAFARPLTAEGAPSFAHSLPPYSSAALLHTRRNTRNSNPVMRLLHNLRIPRVGGRPMPLTACQPTHVFCFPHGEPAPVLEHTSITNLFRMRTYTKHARNPFRIRTSKTQHLKPFRIRTYGKNGEGVLRLGRFSDLSTSRLSVAHSMLRPAP